MSVYVEEGIIHPQEPVRSRWIWTWFNTMFWPTFVFVCFVGQGKPLTTPGQPHLIQINRNYFLWYFFGNVLAVNNWSIWVQTWWEYGVKEIQINQPIFETDTTMQYLPYQMATKATRSMSITPSWLMPAHWEISPGVSGPKTHLSFWG